MKIMLTAINSKYIHSNLAVRYLKAYTKKLNYQAVIREFSINDRVERIAENIVKEKPQVVALSTYIWNLEYVSKVSTLIKLIDPSIQILYGGPEVSYDSMEFLKNNVGEYVIGGEGEESFKEFVEYKLGLREIDTIKGIYYKKDGKIFYNGERPLMKMENIVFPYDEEEDLANKIVYYEASRGCPFNCKYCLSSTLHGVRFLDIDRVKKELKFLIDKKVRLIKFVDRTFNCNSNFAMAIWRFLIDQDTDATFHFEISADILKKEEIELLSKAPKGRFQFEVGVQTTNDEVLRNINRHVNFAHIREKIEEMQKIKNIKQHLDLIAGLPGENYSSFKKSFNDVYSIKPEEIQLGFLKLLKGSPMRMEAKKWGMVYSPYPPYEIISTKNISYNELLVLKKVEEMVDKYYNSQKFNSIIRYFENKFNSPYDFFYELALFFEHKGCFERNISSTDYYKVFLEFNSEILKEDNFILKQIVKYDYLMFNKKKWLPDFLDRSIDRDEEKAIKEYLRKNYPKNNKCHIEKFDIDVIRYVENGNVIVEKSYILYDEKSWNSIEDVTEYI